MRHVYADRVRQAQRNKIRRVGWSRRTYVKHSSKRNTADCRHYEHTAQVQLLLYSPAEDNCSTDTSNYKISHATYTGKFYRECGKIIAFGCVDHYAFRIRRCSIIPVQDFPYDLVLGKLGRARKFSWLTTYQLHRRKKWWQCHMAGSRVQHRGRLIHSAALPAGPARREGNCRRRKT